MINRPAHQGKAWGIYPVQARYRPRIYRWFPENGSVCKLSGVNRYTWLHTNGWQPEADLRGLADAGQRHADLLLAIK